MKLLCRYILSLYLPMLLRKGEKMANRKDAKNDVKREVESYEELGFTNDFMFGKVMSNPDLCKGVLECLLQKEIGELEEAEPQKEFRYTTEGKPIRLDIYTKDDFSIYDAEMQNKNGKSLKELSLAKRSRFYQSSIDVDFLNKGHYYKELPESYVIFVCTFDPFEMGLPVYNFEEICAEAFDKVLESGAHKYFFNAAYAGDDVPENLKKLYHYIQTGEADDTLTKNLGAAVSEAHGNEVWRSEYMKERALFMDYKEEGRQEGLQEGIQQGIAQEKMNTEKETRRADVAEARVKELEKMLAHVMND